MPARVLANDFYYNDSNIIMAGLKGWVLRQIEKAHNSPIWRLFLKGVKGQM